MHMGGMLNISFSLSISAFQHHTPSKQAAD
jgi:hypothetical protein